MAMSSTEIEAYYDSYSKGNGVQRYGISCAGGTSGVNGTLTVKAAVTGAQVWARGHLRVSGATVLYFYSAAAGTLVSVLDYIVAGTQKLPRSARTKAAELLQLKSTADVTVEGVIETLPVKAGNPVPPAWW